MAVHTLVPVSMNLAVIIHLAIAATLLGLTILAVVTRASIHPRVMMLIPAAILLERLRRAMMMIMKSSPPEAVRRPAHMMMITNHQDQARRRVMKRRHQPDQAEETVIPKMMIPRPLQDLAEELVILVMMMRKLRLLLEARELLRHQTLVNLLKLVLADAGRMLMMMLSKCN